MITAKSMEVRDNFKSWCSQAAAGEVIRVVRPGNNYVYIINQETYEKVNLEKRVYAYTSYLYGKDKITNLKRLSEIGKLPENWNNNGAERIPESVIKMVRKLIMTLDYQPEVFPTACDAVQLEWENENNEYLEMEVLQEKINIFEIDKDGGEKQSTIETNPAKIKEIVGEFYDRAV